MDLSSIFADHEADHHKMKMLDVMRKLQLCSKAAYTRAVNNISPMSQVTYHAKEMTELQRKLLERVYLPGNVYLSQVDKVE